MAQVIYAISALGIVAVVAVSMQRSSHVSEQSVYTNEIRTQLVTIGRDIVDEIASQDLPFDEMVDPDRLPSNATYPYVRNGCGLTPEAEFGNDDGCAKSDACLDVDDYQYRDEDDLIEGSRNGLDFEAMIEVRYVDLDDANETPSDPTHCNRSFAKEIIVTVRTNAIQIGGEPMSASYNRVITYPRITTFTY